jgi:hypothetical protein
MNSDAYKPPEARLTDRRSGDGKLYSSGQVGGAAFLGGPLAGCWLMAANYSEFGNDSARWQMLIWGVLGTLAVLGVSFLLPTRLPNALLPAVYAYTLSELADRLQGTQFDQHLAAGGRKHSSWRVVGVSVVCLVVVVAMSIPFVVFLLPDAAPNR